MIQDNVSHCFNPIIDSALFEPRKNVVNMFNAMVKTRIAVFIYVRLNLL